MIKNQAQLTKANAEIELISAAIKNVPKSNNIEDIFQLDIWENRLSELEEEVKEYKSWEDASRTSLRFSLKDLSKAVVAMRVASKMTQKELAEKLGVKEQQIQRYEKQGYLTASFERVIQLFRLLCSDVNIIAYPKRTRISMFSNNSLVVEKAMKRTKENCTIFLVNPKTVNCISG